MSCQHHGRRRTAQQTWGQSPVYHEALFTVLHTTHACQDFTGRGVHCGAKSVTALNTQLAHANQDPDGRGGHCTGACFVSPVEGDTGTKS